MKPKYYFIFISCPKNNPKDKTIWYYYGTKSYMGSRIYDFDDYQWDDIKLYSRKKDAERMAKKILEFKQKYYDWMEFSYEIKDFII